MEECGNLGGREQPVRLQLVQMRERSATAGQRPLAVRCKQDAERVLDWYGLRWRIDDWHRILKTGCRVEYLGHRTGGRIERSVTIKAVIAWRLAAMTLLGRETPELPAEVSYTELQLRVLGPFAKRRSMAGPANLGLAVRTMAVIRGYLYRRTRALNVT